MSAAVADAGDLRSGKSHRDENFPVASFLVHPRHRPPILAFYRFVRTADDVADHAELEPAEKLGLLDRMKASLEGTVDHDEAARALRKELVARSLTLQHAMDLLTAFRTDVTKLRYTDWEDLMGYCRYSAMPVGRFVLDVHGEDRRTWPASDALCSALQVINHLQDCAADYKALDRVYLPLDALAREGLGVEALAAPTAPPGLRRTLVALAERTSELLDRSRPFAGMIRDRRLSLEIAVIQALAERLLQVLKRRDPLSERVHFGKGRMALIAGGAVARHLFWQSRPA
jgi:squalene synthase HpnC